MLQRWDGEPPGRGARLRTTVLWTIGATIAAVALRAPLTGAMAFPDEGGALLVARHWHSGGPGLYGSLFLDRPPLTVLFWRFADALGGIEAGRWLAMGGVVLLVVSAAWAGQLLGGARGARSAAVVAAALAATPILGTQEVDGELLAVPLVMLSCALTLTAARPRLRPRARVAPAFAAGVVAACALLVKQNFAGGLVFATVLGVVALLTRRWSARTTASVLVPGAVGAGVPMLATVAWAARGPGSGTLWYTLYGFRADAGDVIATHDMSAPDFRLGMLGLLALASGIVTLLGLYAWRAHRRVLARDPVTVAILVLAAVEVAGIVLGGSYWPHYLIALVPVSALAAGAMPRIPGHRRWVRASLVLVTGSALVTAVVAATPVARSARSGESALVGWLGRAHQPGDTGFVAYGHANIVEASGLRPAGYPYLWSLPLRVEDPHLTRLAGTLSGRTRPTWLVEWIDLDAWGIDRQGTLAASVSSYYTLVGRVCGTPVYLRDGDHRALPALPSSC
jgi:hypothetical protein